MLVDTCEMSQIPIIGTVRHSHQKKCSHKCAFTWRPLITHIHSDTDAGDAVQGTGLTYEKQLWVQCLAQGYFDIWPGGAVH